MNLERNKVDRYRHRHQQRCNSKVNHEQAECEVTIQCGVWMQSCWRRACVD